MKKIIHLTDLHIGYGELRKKFSELISNLVYSMQPAENYVVVVTGDLVENAIPKNNFHRANDMLKTLKNAGYDVLVVPGNHDYGDGISAYKENMESFKKNFYGNKHQAFPKLDIITDPKDNTSIAFIGLDSMAGEFDDHDPRLFAQGDLGKTQRDELDTMLASPGVISADKRIIYLHHHPIDKSVSMKLNDSDKLARVLKRHKVDALLFGHKHEGNKWNPRWGITRLYDGGTSTGKAGDPWRHRVIDLTQDPRMDYDGDFL
jgi:3',5'-cyclic AMP phosphodiesterase CpdA